MLKWFKKKLISEKKLSIQRKNKTSKRKKKPNENKNLFNLSTQLICVNNSSFIYTNGEYR